MKNIKTKENLLISLLERFKDTGSEFRFNVAITEETSMLDITADLFFSASLESALINCHLLKSLISNGLINFLHPAFIHNTAANAHVAFLSHYARVYRGSNYLKRSEIHLLQKVKQNKGGKIEFLDAHQVKKERYYIEEFFLETDPEYELHKSILFIFDKFIAHVDKTDHFQAFPVILLNDITTPGFIGLDNHWEKLDSPDEHLIQRYIDLINKIYNKLQDRIRLKADIEDKKIRNQASLDDYYQNIWIDQDEITEFRKTGKLKDKTTD
jgi:hypothetical protein